MQQTSNELTPKPSKVPASSITTNANHKKRQIIPCIHRDEYVGVLDCACDGSRNTYRCTKIDRPGHVAEKAFCMAVLTSKPYSKIVDLRTKKVLHRVANGEEILCKPPFTVDMNGGEHRLGCSMYSPTASLES